MSLANALDDLVLRLCIGVQRAIGGWLDTLFAAHHESHLLLNSRLLASVTCHRDLAFEDLSDSQGLAARAALHSSANDSSLEHAVLTL